MAFSPHVSVRLSPAQLSHLEFLAERSGTKPATFAHEILVAYIRRELEDPAVSRAAQERYFASLQTVIDEAAALGGPDLSVGRTTTYPPMVQKR